MKADYRQLGGMMFAVIPLDEVADAAEHNRKVYDEDCRRGVADGRKPNLGPVRMWRDGQASGRPLDNSMFDMRTDGSD